MAGRLPTADEDAAWTSNGTHFDPSKLNVQCGPPGEFRTRLVVASLYGVVHRDTFDTDNAFRRQKFRETCQSKFGIEDDTIQESLEQAILAKADAADARADSEPLLQCSTIRLSDVTPEQVEWLWRERFAIGKLSLLVGDPGQGKSFLTLDIAARVSRGAAWPDNPWEPQQPGDVILLGAEDDLGDTTRPRLDALAADVSRIIAIKGAKLEGDDHDRMINLATDLASIRKVVQSANQPRAIIIDPVSAYLGSTDSHKNAEVRSVLAPLSDLAAELRVAVIAVSHLRKGEGAALYRTMGSLAFIAAARSA
jgi:RecA-family ATPase